MSYIRKLPSGKWQATVYGRDGKRHSHTAALKSMVQQWARQQEFKPAQLRRDPRAGDVKIADWRKRYAAAHARQASAPRNASLWSVHCEPQWGTWALSAVTRMEAQEWVTGLARTVSQRGQDSLLSPATIHATVRVMSALYNAAVRDQIVEHNPFAALVLPPIQPAAIFYYEPAEADALYSALDVIGDRVLVELGMTTGLRWEELAGLHGHRVDWLRGRLEVVDVMTRQGLRQHPKSRRSHRTVPVPPKVLQGMSVLMRGRERDDLVFTSMRGGPISYANFRNRVWYDAVARAGVRKYPPRVMRHTAASWLVQDGVPLYDVQALLGHESFQTTMRYAHLAPDAHSKVLASWARRTTEGNTG